VKSFAALRYPHWVSELEIAIDVEAVARVLVSLGIDEAYVHAQLSLSHVPAEQLKEAAFLAAESEAALTIPFELSMPVSLFELVDGLRQAGLGIVLGKTARTELSLALSPPRAGVYEVSILQGARASDLVRFVASLLPDTHVLLTVDALEQISATTVVIITRDAFAALRAAVSKGAMERVMTRVVAEPRRIIWHLSELPQSRIDLRERFEQRPPLEAAKNLDALLDRVHDYDPRVPWPADHTRPPGDDFYELCQAMIAAQHLRCLRDPDPKPLAQLLFRFAFVTLIGAQCDLLSARFSPGLSAQGLLGFGQLTWAYFIFEALGAYSEAEQTAVLLEQPWVQSQERGAITLRQRAYYDLFAFMRSGERGPALGRIAEIMELKDFAAWQDAERVYAALAAHSEPWGDQFTHHPLYFTWPATLYALARRAGAAELLTNTYRDNPFLARPLSIDQVDHEEALLVRLREQRAGFEALDAERLPQVLDPLPVIVDVLVTHVEREEAFGHTLLSAHDDAEHLVRAKRAGRDIKPGEVWTFEVKSSHRSTRTAHYADLGEVRCTIALPTGEWLEKAQS